MTRSNRSWRRLVWLAAAGLLLLPLAARAHPHVWVTVETTVLYDHGKVSGFAHKWTFDEMYTTMAIEGLDTNGDGTYSKEELAELAKINIEGLKEFGYFTYAKLGEKKLETKEPVDYWLEMTGGVLSLHFTLPLAAPVAADAKGFTFQVYDETFFIAFDFAKDKPVTLGSGAPHGCAASLGVPQKDLDQLQSLNQAFGGQMTAGNANMGMGFGYAPTVTVSCKT